MEKDINYRLTVKGNVKMSSMMDSFKTSGSYILRENGYNAVKTDLLEYILVEKNVELLEYFDPNTYQLIEYVNKLAGIYNRQHICVNDQGQIKGLLNMPEIKEKWDVLKREIMQVNPISSFEIIKNKDRELNDPVEVIGNLSNTHFMALFLHTYGMGPGHNELKRIRSLPDRMGIGFMMPIIQQVKIKVEADGYIAYSESNNDQIGWIGKQAITKATGQEELDIKHHSHGNFQYNTNGVLLSAELAIFEQLNLDYCTDLYLKLEVL